MEEMIHDMLMPHLKPKANVRKVNKKAKLKARQHAKRVKAQKRHMAA